MGGIELLKALLVGIVQGITEWLPVSSTGHMILLDSFLKLEGGDAFKGLFLVALHLGSLFAVMGVFLRRFRSAVLDRGAVGRQNRRLLLLALVGCLPAGIAGVFLEDQLEALFYNPRSVSLVLLLYGVVFVLMERLRRARVPRLNNTEELSLLDALLIGLFQVLALVPGTSRSGATILGATLLGVGRSAAAEFSFLMALPLMAGATLFECRGLVATGISLTFAEMGALAVGMLAAFLVSRVAVGFLLDFVRKHSFEVFGWYRIFLSVVLLLYTLF